MHLICCFFKHLAANDGHSNLEFAYLGDLKPNLKIFYDMNQKPKISFNCPIKGGCLGGEIVSNPWTCVYITESLQNIFLLNHNLGLRFLDIYSKPKCKVIKYLMQMDFWLIEAVNRRIGLILLFNIYRKLHSETKKHGASVTRRFNLSNQISNLRITKREVKSRKHHWVILMYFYSSSSFFQRQSQAG
jgi:hypothetical protein